MENIMMRSIQVARVYRNQPEEIARFTELQVMNSAAGYYIGTAYNAIEGYQEPGSRDSDYYATKEEADWAFRYLENLWLLCKHELCPEDIANKWADQMWKLGRDKRRVGYRFEP